VAEPEAEGGNSGSAVVQLLENGAGRIGTALGKDLVQAAEKVYTDVKTGVVKVIQGVEQADSQVAAEFRELSEQIEHEQIPTRTKVYVTNNGYPDRDYQRKLSALNRAADSGTLGATTARDAAQTKAYRRTLKKRIMRRYGTSDPAKAQNMIDALKTRDIDHITDLQLGGVDGASNFKSLNSGVNRSLGAQIAPQIRNLPPGTQIEFVNGPKP
jgi:hypothetical protein